MEPAKEFPKPHVVCRSKLVAARSAMSEPVRHAMQQGPGNLAQLIHGENPKPVEQRCGIFFGAGA